MATRKTPPDRKPKPPPTGNGDLDFSKSTGDYTGLLAIFEDI